MSKTGGKFEAEDNGSTSAIVKEAQRLAKMEQYAEALELIADIKHPKVDAWRGQLRLKLSAQKQHQKVRRKRLQIVAVVVGVVILIVLISIPILYQNIVAEAISATQTARPTPERIFTSGEFAGYTCDEARATLVAEGKSWARSACEENISELDAEATGQAMQDYNQQQVCYYEATQVALGKTTQSEACK